MDRASVQVGLRRALASAPVAAILVASACAVRSTQERPAPPADAGCGVHERGCRPAPPPAQPAPEAAAARRRPPPGTSGRPPAAGASRTRPAAPRAAPPQRAAPQIAALLAAKAARTPAQRKISADLLARAASAAAGAPPADRRQPADARAGAAEPAGPSVLVDVRADVTPALLARIRDLGGAVVNSAPRYRAIRARLPPAGLEPVAERADVQWIRTADQPRTRPQQRPLTAARGADPFAPAASHKVDTSEGDAAHEANVARSTHSVDGTGIGIGVLSDGVDTLADQQATGDVPSHVSILPGQEGGAFDLSCGRRSNGSEGTAMMEIVHDLAPGAELFFATGGGGPAQMAQNIENLCTAGADVIVDDIGYLLAPAFQGGAIARAVSAVTAKGCHYFSSAGNGGNFHHGWSSVWEGDFAAGASLDLSGVGAGATYHDFGGGRTANRMLHFGQSLISLQWSDPLGGSANDYDLFVIDRDNNVVASSTSTQDGTQDPLEYIPASCSQVSMLGHSVVIVKNAGAADRYLRLDANSWLAVGTTGGTFGHAALQDAVGVGAVRVPTGGGAFEATATVEKFSSDGPRRIFYEADGTAITAGDFSSTGGRLLDKPDVAAANGVSTSTPGFAPFSGTSAAAPHAAAIGALMVEAAGGPAQLTPAALRTAMTGNALDILATGVDPASGAGIAMAPGAVDAVDVVLADRNRAPTVTAAPSDRTFEPGADAVTIDLADVFDDPDDDTLTYSVQPAAGSLVALSGSLLTLTPGAPAPAVVVVVRATDPDGLTTMRHFSVTVSVGDRDYDGDDDNLIDIATLAQLDAVRYDLNGDGAVDGTEWEAYYGAFDEGVFGMGCPDGCVGYELTTDLDFDTNGSGDADAGDDYWNDGEGWAPIGDGTAKFEAIFEGNRRTISHLFVDRGDYSGLFGETGPASLISRVGLVDAGVTGESYVGGLVGGGAGEIFSSYVTGAVDGDSTVGGLIGSNGGAVGASFATARVTADDVGGGLAGSNAADARILASYATGRVSGDESGGLVGRNNGTVAASYATGRVLGSADVGGLAGGGSGVFRASYWDRETSGVRVGRGADDLDDDGWLEAGEPPTPGVAGQSTSNLQAHVDYDGIYATWNLDLDGDAAPDRPWFLSSAGNYPILSSLDYDAGGYQLSQGPTLTAATSAGQAQVTLTWSALNAGSFWVDGPGITYNLIRDDGATFGLLAEDGTGLQYTDTDVTVGTTYTYQVAAVVQGGEPTRSAALPVVAGAANQPPAAVGRLADRTLRVGGSAVTVDVAGAFRDPEGDALTYAASSSAPGVATASASGTAVTVTPVGEGEATITVTATDTAGSNTSAAQRFTAAVWSATAVDYDTDDDGLIEIATLAQLDAVRHDLDGDGTPASGGSSSYRTAFADAGDRLGCGGVDGCTGYELAADLDFDTDGSGGPDAGDTYWNAGAGWDPIGSDSEPFAATFDGNGRTIANLFIDVGGGFGVVNAGLFGVAATTSVIRGVGLTGVAVRAQGDFVGGLVGDSLGVISGSYAAGRVTGDDFVGGLVGWSAGVVAASYATGRVAGDLAVGGLAGVGAGAVVATYATARVEGRSGVGGLVGFVAGGTVNAGYATGPVSGTGGVGGLVGSISSISGGEVTAGYWDTRTSDLSGGDHGEGRSTSALQGPTGYSGLYGGWTVDLDGDGRRDSPWHFGTDRQYPALAPDLDGSGQATWQAMGHQLRQGPVLSGAGQPTEVALTWTAADASQWSPEPAIRYTVFRGVGAGAGIQVELLVEEVDALQHTDTDVVAGTTYTYQVAAVVDGGEATWSAPVRVTVDDPPPPLPPRGGGGGGGGGGRPAQPNRPPEAVGELTNRTLTLGAEPVVVDVAAAFRDADRDALTYAAESSAEDVAAVAVEGGVVTVTPVGAGTAVVTVTASDGEEESAPATQAFTVTVVIDYDADADGLIEVRTPAQLDAVRHDLDGDGVPSAAGEAAHAAAFEGAIGGLSCGGAGCRGYELLADLDFDTNGSGGPDAGDAYWNDGLGWSPIGTEAEPFTAAFEGNGRVIRGLFVAGGEGAGLLGATGTSSVVARVGLVAVDVTGAAAVGALAGRNGGRVTAAWATGRVSGIETVGGLVGANTGNVGGSYAAVAVSGERQVGGLAGVNEGRLVAVHAAGRASGTAAVGGLVGRHRGALTASYATGRVRGESETGGLVGALSEPGTVTASYWDTETSGLRSSAAGRGLTTSALQRQTSYGGVYAAWNVDADGDGELDGPWHLGTAAQYPALSLDADGDGRASWPELGRQLRAGPELTAAPRENLAAEHLAEVVLTWTAAETSAWTAAPEVAYTVTREVGSGVETVAAGVRGARYVDADVQPGSSYTYQVAAVVDGGEAARSARVTAEVPCAYAVTPLHRDVLWAAGTGRVAVATAPGCAWTAASESAFLAVTAGAAGAGPGTVRYTVAANAGGPRRGTLAVAGRAVTVYQASPTQFTDHPIERGVTPVKAIHFLELRARVDALRAAAGRPAFGWQDPVLAPGATPIRRAHLTELRAALAEAYTAAGRAAPSYTDPVVAAGATAIRAAHLMELRAAVAALE